MSTYEFSSFRAMNDHLHNAPAIRGRKPEPWLPAGPNPSHFRTLGLSSKEEVAAIATKSQEEVEREGVETKLSGTEAAFDRLEAALRSTEAEYEAHVLSASAASVLIAKRLAMLGVGPEA